MSQISFYTKITNTIPTRAMTIQEVLQDIGSTRYKEQIEQIRVAPDKPARDRLKKNLPYYTMGGTFSERANSKLIKASNLINFDIDDLEDPEKTREELKQDPYIHYIFLSPSGNGLKLGVVVPGVRSDAEYKQYWTAISQHFKLSETDTSAKDIARACFVSYDPNYYLNEESTTFIDKSPSVQEGFSYIGMFLDSTIIDIMARNWAKGKRQVLALYLVAILRQKGYGTVAISSILRQICRAANDTDMDERLNTIKTTFEKNETEVKGFSGLKEELPEDDYKLFLDAVDEKIKKIKKSYKLYNITSHIPMYDTLDRALGLYGKRYDKLKKLLWYSLLGNTIKEGGHIDYNGTMFDTRESTIIFAPSGSGKNDISRVYMTASPFLHEKSDVTSLHPEQLIGKVVYKKEKGSNEKKKYEIRGYFDDDIVVMDEARDFFLPTKNNSQKQQFTELRKYFCTALNPIGTNEITKQLTEHGKEGALKYYPKSTCCFLSQPVKISTESIQSGFMRRFTFIEIKGRDSREDIYLKRAQGTDKTKYTDELCNYFGNLRINGNSWVFQDISKPLIKYTNLLCEYGVAYSEKSASFVKEIYEQSMYDKVLKYAALVAVTRTGCRKITETDIKIAYMDLFEIFTSTFDCLDAHAEDFFTYGVSYNDLLILRWLKKRGATSIEKSNMNVSSVVNAMCDIYECKKRWAAENFSRLKKEKYVEVLHGKSNAVVILGEKGLKQLKIDEESSTDEEFYHEYKKICEELENGRE